MRPDWPEAGTPPVLHSRLHCQRSSGRLPHFNFRVIPLFVVPSLCSRRAPKAGDKSSQIWLKLAKTGHAVPLFPLPSPLCGCPILPRAFRSQTTCLLPRSAQNFTAQKQRFGKEKVKFCTSHQPLTSTAAANGKEKVKFWNSLKHSTLAPAGPQSFRTPLVYFVYFVVQLNCHGLCQSSSLRAFVVPVADDIFGNFKFRSRFVTLCHVLSSSRSVVNSARAQSRCKHVKNPETRPPFHAVPFSFLALAFRWIG